MPGTLKHGPDADTLHPLPGFPQLVFLKNTITRDNIEVGDFTYFDEKDGALDFENRNVLYHFDFVGDRLIIGKFCALASGVSFIMNGANHALGGLSTYPFSIFGGGWEEGFDPASFSDGNRGDTIVGNDVWIGNGARILPGVTIGNGAIIGASAVVSADIPAYAIVAGNPARVIRKRFDEATIEMLEEISWWDWPLETITKNINAIRSNDITLLQGVAVASKAST